MSMTMSTSVVSLSTSLKGMVVSGMVSVDSGNRGRYYGVQSIAVANAILLFKYESITESLSQSHSIQRASNSSTGMEQLGQDLEKIIFKTLSNIKTITTEIIKNRWQKNLATISNGIVNAKTDLTILTAFFVTKYLNDLVELISALSKVDSHMHNNICRISVSSIMLNHKTNRLIKKINNRMRSNFQENSKLNAENLSGRSVNQKSTRKEAHSPSGMPINKEALASSTSNQVDSFKELEKLLMVYLVTNDFIPEQVSVLQAKVAHIEFNFRLFIQIISPNPFLRDFYYLILDFSWKLQRLQKNTPPLTEEAAKLLRFSVFIRNISFE